MACPFVSCILFLDKNKIFVKILFHKDNDSKTKSNQRTRLPFNRDGGTNRKLETSLHSFLSNRLRTSQIWTGHSTLISENLKPVEISKNHFNLFKTCIDFQNQEGEAQKLSLPCPFCFRNTSSYKSHNIAARVLSFWIYIAEKLGKTCCFYMFK